MKAVVDTDVLAAIIAEDSEYRDEALRLWEMLDEAVVPAIVFCELAYILISSGHDVGLLDEALRDPKVRLVETAPADIRFAQRHRHYVEEVDDYNDLLVLGAAVRLGLPLLTFDAKLNSVAEKIRGR